MQRGVMLEIEAGIFGYLCTIIPTIGDYIPDLVYHEGHEATGKRSGTKRGELGVQAVVKESYSSGFPYV
jgi:hypothetical protein